VCGDLLINSFLSSLIRIFIASTVIGGRLPIEPEAVGAARLEPGESGDAGDAGEAGRGPDLLGFAK